jgi:hypothetical protein
VYSTVSDGISVPKAVRATRGSEKVLMPVNITTAASKLHVRVTTFSRDNISSIHHIGNLVNWIGEWNEKKRNEDAAFNFKLEL